MIISTVKRFELHEFATLGINWRGMAIVLMTLLLPAGAIAQSVPANDPAVSQEEVVKNAQPEFEINVQQNIYQEQGVEPSDLDYSNPYQQPVTTESELDQLEQAQKSLGVPESRRPQFNNFFGAEERAIISREESENFP